MESKCPVMGEYIKKNVVFKYNRNIFSLKYIHIYIRNSVIWDKGAGILVKGYIISVRINKFRSSIVQHGVYI
jgi:hypothetical protein